MDAKANGAQPAHPVPDRLSANVPRAANGAPAAAGLTKRELFAAMVMQGLCAHYGQKARHETARFAVLQADALLAELAKDGSP